MITWALGIGFGFWVLDALIGILVLLYLLLFGAKPHAQQTEPLYRIRRWPVAATAPQWDHAEELIPLSAWRCNLDPGVPGSRSARMPDPVWADKDCEWTAEPGAWIFSEGALGNYFGAYRYDLAVKLDEFGGWSEPVERQPIGPLPSTPTGFRVTP